MSGFLSEIIPPAGDRVANFRSTSFQATLIPHSQYVHAVKNWFTMDSENQFKVVAVLNARAISIDHSRTNRGGCFPALSQGKDRPRLDKKLSRGAHNRPNVEMTFQRVPACTQLERLGKSGDKVVVCRLSRSLGRDS
jgi:hypothetical protein